MCRMLECAYSLCSPSTVFYLCFESHDEGTVPLLFQHLPRYFKVSSSPHLISFVGCYHFCEQGGSQKSNEDTVRVSKDMCDQICVQKCCSLPREEIQARAHRVMEKDSFVDNLSFGIETHNPQYSVFYIIFTPRVECPKAGCWTAKNYERFLLL